MNINSNSALYYPYICFQDYEWLWVSALLWDRLYRIVPKGFEPNDPDNIKQLLDGGEIGIYIEPEAYSAEVSDSFIKNIESHHWTASALKTRKDKEGYSRLHREKIDSALRKIIIDRNIGKYNGDWLSVPREFASIYMTYLANDISSKNNLSLITDTSTAWTSNTYFRYAEEIEQKQNLPRASISDIQINNEILAIMTVKDFIPKNVLNIQPTDILKFRRQRKYERQRFLSAINNSATKLSNCSDPKIKDDILHEIKDDIDSSMLEYKKSMDILNVVGWCGLSSIALPAVSALFHNVVPSGSPVIDIGSITIGAMACVGDLAFKSKPQRNSDYSYLFEIQDRWGSPYYNRDIGGYNHWLNDRMFEFVND